MAAYSQGVTHFIGRLLQKFNFKKTPIDTLGAKKLKELMEQTCNDTWQLFFDLQTFNPYTKTMRLKLGRAYDFLFNKLLPKRVNKKYLVFGIQGGRGSFNEEALLTYVKEKDIKNYKIRYLYTTKNVFKALYKGKIDYGVFAIVNSKGGIVNESIEEMVNYKFRIVDKVTIFIRHFLMKKKEIPFSKISQIMAHPQVFAQCQNNLKKKYPHLKLISGKNEMIDTAKAAKALSQGKVEKTIAILGPKMLSEIYNFEIVDADLQDDKENKTTFLIVKRG
jgi:hypothetical protein